MSDFETRLREALRETVPPDLEPTGLAEGARGYAVRARRVRMVASAGVAVVILMVLGLAFTGFRFTATPAGQVKKSSVVPPLCAKRLPQPSVPPAKGEALFGDVEASLCPRGGTTSLKGAGWTLPTISMTDETWISRFRSAIAAEDPAHPCALPESAIGPAFTVVLRHNSGRLITFRSVVLSCRGRDALAAFLGDLSLEQARWQAASVGPADIDCAFSRNWEARPPSPPMKGKDLVRTTGVLCLYPYFDPDGRDPLVARPPHRIELSQAQVAAINADLEQATLRESSTAAKPGACRQTRWTLVLRLRTPGVHPLGPDPDLMSTCTDEFVLATTNLRWELKPDTADVIASLLPEN